MKRKLLLSLALGLTATASIEGQTLTQTNLPIVIINTNGGSVADTQILSSIKIVSNATGLNQPGDAPAFQGNIGIKYRGSSGNPKRSYSIETWTNTPKQSLDVSLLGMPAENDWVLLACYNDRSLMRNLIGFHLFQQMGYYAPRMKLVEVLLNNNYEGIYLFGEKIKRDQNRLDLANLKITDVSGSALTGGYIFRIDNSNDNYWTSSVPPPHAQSGQTIKFHFEEPADNVISGVQQAYIKSYTDSFEAALLGGGFQDTSIGWRKFAGHNSFEDFFLFNEVLKSGDAYRLGTYIYKDKDKKLRAGPPWDLELALYNTTNCNASKDTGWAFQYGLFCGTDPYLPPFWWERLVADTAYIRDVKCKYTHFRNSILDTASLFNLIDSVSTMLNHPQGQPLTRNFQKWPIWGVSLVNEPAPVSNSYGEEVTKIKEFLKRRFQYLDSKWLTPGCILNIAPVSAYPAISSIYPNPAHESFTAIISLQKPTPVSLIMRDLLGRVVLKKEYEHLPSGTHRVTYSVSELPIGVYSISISADQQAGESHKLIKQ